MNLRIFSPKGQISDVLLNANPVSNKRIQFFHQKIFKMFDIFVRYFFEKNTFLNRFDNYEDLI